MSSYLNRFIEVKVKDYSFSLNEEMFNNGIKPSDAKIGDYFIVNISEVVDDVIHRKSKSYQITESGDVEVSYKDVPLVWKLLTFSEITPCACSGYLHGEHIVNGFSNNSGLLRDDFFGVFSSSYGLSKRGFPDDISKEMSDKFECVDFKFSHSHTYVTLMELENTLSYVRDKMVSDLSGMLMTTDIAYLSGLVGKLIKKVNKDDDGKKIRQKDFLTMTNKVVDDYMGNDYGNYFDDYVALSGEIDTIKNIVSMARFCVDYDEIRIIYYID